MIQITHFIHKDAHGGGPKVVRQLLEFFNPSEYRQSVITSGNGTLTDWCQAHQIPIFHVPSHSPLSSLLHLRKISNAFKITHPQVAILHGQWAGPIGALATRLAKIPRSIYIAHLPAFYHSTSLPRAIRNAVAEMIPCKLASRVVALSQSNHYNYLYRGWAHEKKLCLIPNGLDPDELPDPNNVTRLKSTWNFAPPPARHAVFVGRVDDQKRLDWLISAWNFALTQKPPTADWHLWIVGSGSELPKIKSLAAQSPLPHSIHFTGPQTNGLDWIAAADLVVMSSLYEGHALVPLEAMACSKPIAAFACDGVSESVADGITGLLSPLGKTHHLGRSIATLLNNPTLSSQMGTNAHSHLHRNFHIQKTIHAYEQLLDNLTLPHHPSQPPQPPPCPAHQPFQAK